MPSLKHDGLTLSYDVYDLTPPWLENPETIIFHHGVGIDRDIWIDWLPVLADRYRLARFDMRGFGGSTAPGPGAKWSMAALAEDVLAVGMAAGTRRFHFVGESLGGTLGLYLAIHHPGSVLSVCACSTAHRGGSIQRVREWREFIAREGMVNWSKMMMDLRFYPDSLPIDTYRWFDRVQGSSASASVLDAADMLIDTDLTDRLAEIESPLLLIAPDRSPFVPVEFAADIHARVRASELQVIAGARHGVVCSHGRQSAEVYKSFLARHRS